MARFGVEISRLAEALITGIDAIYLSSWYPGNPIGTLAHVSFRLQRSNTRTYKNWEANFLCNIGHGDPARLFPRAPRFDFDEDALPLGVALLSAATAAYVLPDAQ